MEHSMAFSIRINKAPLRYCSETESRVNLIEKVAYNCFSLIATSLVIAASLLGKFQCLPKDLVQCLPKQARISY